MGLKRVWNTVDGVPDELSDVVKFIHPLRQKAVSDAINEARKNRNVIRLIVFGSSATGMCTPDSDVDLYVVEDGVRTFVPPTTAIFDVVTPEGLTMDDHLVKEILRDGIKVYEREDFS